MNARACPNAKKIGDPSRIKMPSYLLMGYRIHHSGTNMGRRSTYRGYMRYHFYATPEFMNQVDELAKRMGIPNRSELIRIGLMCLLEKWGNERTRKSEGEG